MDILFEDSMRRSIVVLNDYGAPFSYLLPDIENVHYWYLNRIDPYAHTVFNQLQAPRLLLEWDAFVTLLDTNNPRLQEVVAAVRILIVRLGEEMHRYLRFRGE